MAITVTERNALVRAVMLTVGEDAQLAGRLLHFLQAEAPTYDWLAILTNIANNWQPFRDSGLSVTWWINEVDRYRQVDWD